MTNDISIIFFGASVAVSMFAIVTFFVVVSYHKALRRQKQLEDELNSLRLHGSAEVNKILLDAQAKAAEIIKDAQLKSQEFINTSSVFGNEFREKFQNNLLDGTNKIISNVSKDISSQVGAEVKVFGQALNASLSKMLEDSKIEIENYKKNAMEDVNKKIFNIVADTVKKSIGKTLTKQEHEKLVMQALEEAKKKNVF